MKKITGFVVILSIIAAGSCSRHKKYGDIREFINEVVKTQDEFLTQIDNAANTDDVVSAVDLFGTKLIALSEKSKEIKKGYPEMEKLINEPPAELKYDLGKLNDSERKIEEVFVKEKIKTLIKEKKVQTSLIELNKKLEMVKFFQ